MTEVAPPVVDGRSEAAVLAAVRARLPGYLPGWQPAPGSPADALHKVFAAFTTIVVRALNAALPRARFAFLDACGESQRPAQAASVPLVFTLADQSPVDAFLPAGMAVAAQPTQGAAGDSPDPPSFVVAQAITIARARLAALYSIDPLEDRWDDHTSLLTQGFTLFEGAGVVEHALYLGHDTVLKLPAGDAKVIVQAVPVDVQPPAREDLRLRWEYWSDSGWRPLAGAIADLLITDQQADLRKEGGPATAALALLGRSSYWIRGTLTEPLFASGGSSAGSLPLLDTVRVSLDVGGEDLAPDAVATDGRLIDGTAPFQPFGASPIQGTTFHLGSSAAFGRPGANVRVDIRFDGNPQAAAGPITFEYYTGETWKPLSIGDTTNVLARNLSPAASAARDGVITFVAPPDWKPFTIGRASSHFLRARLDGKEVFGNAAYFTGNDFHPADWVPPLIASLRISFSQVSAPLIVDHCLTSNGGVLADLTQAAQSPQSPFQPFRPVDDQQPAVYLGFDNKLPSGLVSLFVDVPPEPDVAPPDNSSPFLWEYLSASGWRELGARDETLGFRTSGFIQFIGPFDHVASDGPGGQLYRVRARLKQGARLPTQTIGGVWFNAVQATQASSYSGETVGRGTGRPRQLVAFPQTRVPILEGERIEIREWTGRDRGYEAILETVAEADRRVVVDPATGQTVEVWVRWSARPHLFDATPGDRVYTLDRVMGLLRFGDGRRGLVPPAGALIVASFSAGGGLAGNVPADSVTVPRAAIPFLGSVTNPRPARGGSAAEPLETTQLRGAHRLRHRGRALAPADFEWLAVEASPAVARARCLPLTGEGNSAQRGWVTVVIVPHSADRRPQPDDELAARVRAYLRDRAPATLANRICVIGPQYLPVSVVAEIVPARPEDARTVESALRGRLDDFLHPLRGGQDGRGWQVGQGVPLSQVAAIVEGTPGVDFARQIGLRVAGAVYGNEVPGRPETLVAPGGHELRLMLRAEAC